MLVQTFAANFGTVKERDFSAMVAKVWKTKQDLLLTSIEQGELLDCVDAMAAVLAACKQAVRPCANYQKSHKTSHLAKLHSPLCVIFDYLKLNKMAVAPDIKAVHLKAGFHTMCHESGFEAGLEFLDENQPQCDDSNPKWLPGELLTDCCQCWMYEFLSRPLSTKKGQQEQKGEEIWMQT